MRIIDHWCPQPDRVGDQDYVADIVRLGGSIMAGVVVDRFGLSDSRHGSSDDRCIRDLRFGRWPRLTRARFVGYSSASLCLLVRSDLHNHASGLRSGLYCSGDGGRELVESRGQRDGVGHWSLSDSAGHDCQPFFDRIGGVSSARNRSVYQSRHWPSVDFDWRDCPQINIEADCFHPARIDFHLRAIVILTALFCA